MSKGEKRPSWFKLFLHQKPIIDSVPDEVAGRALKAALRYFDTGEVVELDSLSGVVFAALRPHIDEAFKDFRRSVDTGRAGGQKRWSKEGARGDSPPIDPLSPPIDPLSPPIGVSTEAEADADAEADAEKEADNKADKPPSRHKYGSYKNVLFTDEEYAKLQEEFPADYSERIERLSEYIASTGKSYKSHLATIRSWARKDGAKASTMPSYGGEENWSL